MTLIKKTIARGFAVFAFMMVVGTSNFVHGADQAQKEVCKPYRSGTATIYSDKFENRKTTNGEIFSQQALTAAALEDVPLGTKLRVRNTENQQTVYVTANDRGKFKHVLDLSKKAALDLGFDLKRGRFPVAVEICKLANN